MVFSEGIAFWILVFCQQKKINLFPCCESAFMAILQWNSYKSRVEIFIWFVQLLLLMVGVISTVLVFKGAVTSYIFNIKFSGLPTIWILIKAWLSPPYIYIILNFIIISIAASSTFRQSKKNSHDGPNIDQDCNLDGALSPSTHRFQADSRTEEEETVASNNVQSHPIQNQMLSNLNTIVKISAQFDDKHLDYCLKKSDEKENMEKPIFLGPAEIEKTITTIESHPTNHHREFDTNTKHLESTEMKIDNGEEYCTMDSTWKAIMEGGKPPAIQLKKAWTWNESTRAAVKWQTTAVKEASVTASAAWKELRKWETFNDCVSIRRKGGLRRDPSMNNDELNRKAEAFIKKFNNEMRLERQESDQRFMDMINRGL